MNFIRLKFMGIPISSLFINIKECEKKLKDIIFDNFYYYFLVSDYTDEEFIESIEESCKFLLEREMNTKFDDYSWDYIWLNYINKLRTSHNVNYLFI